MGNADKIACYALTQSGLDIAKSIAKVLNISIFTSKGLSYESCTVFDSLKKCVGENFCKFQAHIFITATGIAIRCIATHIVHKSIDPAVIVCDHKGKFVISLLSGHWGGANLLAKNIAKILDATPVITTATDLENVPSIDIIALDYNYTILDWDKVKLINMALLEGKKIQLIDPVNALNACKSNFTAIAQEQINFSEPAVAVHWEKIKECPKLLRICLPALHVGIGFRRHVNADEILKALEESFEMLNLEIKSIARLASVSIKQDQPAMHTLSQKLQCSLIFFPAEELSEVQILSPSNKAAQIFNVPQISVCESSALLSAGENSTLISKKIKYKNIITLAIAVNKNSFLKKTSLTPDNTLN